MGGILIGACTAGVYSLTMAIGTIPTISDNNFELFVRGPGKLLVSSQPHEGVQYAQRP